jgi:SAM-dependent methyltransferase
MGISRFMYGLLYRVGYTPWDGHPASVALSPIVSQLEMGKALDIGCGTGDTTIYLAQKGWDVTGVDFVAKAIARAQKKAASANVKVRYLRADVTQLSSSGAGGGFTLITDGGCLHGLDDEQRVAYAREVTQAAAPGAHLLISAFLPGKRRGPSGIDRAGIERLFTRWKLLESGVEEWEASTGERLSYYHLALT